MSVKTAEAKDRFLALYEESREGSRRPAWLSAERELAIARFGELGFPTTRDEDWKYTDVAAAVSHDFELNARADVAVDEIEPHFLREAEGARLVFVNGRLDDSLSSLVRVGDGVALFDLADPAADSEQVRAFLGALTADSGDRRGGAFALLNLATTEGGPVLLVPAGRELEATVQVVYVTTGTTPVLASPRALVVVGEQARARIVETFLSIGDAPSLTNAAAEIVLERGAAVEHYRVQQQSVASAHVGSTDVRVARDASYQAVSLHFGAALSRHDLRVRLVEPGASCRIDGLYAVEGRQHADSHTTIDHSVPDCTSSQLYKGVLDGASRAVFNGRVLVRPDAQRTNAFQTNKNLVLSPEARVDTKPELEILADDVKCAHGATVGALDEDQRFYLASRGVDDETARGLLTFGFAEEIVAEVRTESLRAILDELVLTRFRKGTKAW